MTRWVEPETVIASDPDGRVTLCVLTKRTYEVDLTGRVRICEEQYPLDTSGHTPPPGVFDDTWKAEVDAAPFKVGTDVVVFGRAHAPHVGCREMIVELRLPDRQVHVELAVSGDRRCEYRPSGDPVIGPAEAFETMPIGYDRAYGGIDPFVEPPHEPRDGEEALSWLLRHPGIYPRNTVGRGYAVHNRRELVDGLYLPNVERPDQRLRADRILVKDPRRWWQQPLPGGFGWFDVSWFPRCVFASALPLFPAPSAIPEVKLGLLPGDFDTAFRTNDGDAPRIDHRLFSAASPGLTLPYLRGDETFLITGLCSGGIFNVRLPGERPKIAIAYHGRRCPVQVVPHTVALLSEERRLFVVWRGSTPHPDPHALHTSREEDPTNAFQVSVA